jgi:hypothetical protein
MIPLNDRTAAFRKRILTFLPSLQISPYVYRGIGQEASANKRE